VRSVRRVSAVCVATLPFAVLLTGCVSTQRIAARARLVSARELASQSTTGVVQANADVTVRRLTLIHTRTGTAVVASLRNNSSNTLTDLPISVGIHTPAKHAVYLNRSANLDYFDSHIAAIAPHGVTTWVFTTRRRVPGGRPFATVGVSQLPSSAGGRLPQIDVSVRAGRSAPGSIKVDVSVSNRSGIPQYDLQVYAVAIRGGRDVGAGRTAVTHLGTNATTTLSITLLGGTQRAALRLIALPTIFN
jgi:hypothetical protein